MSDLGSKLKYLRVPDYHPEFEVLKDKKMIVVDDVVGVLQNLIPECISATNGNANAIHYKGEAIEVLVEAIFSQNPDILLMDYHLFNTPMTDDEEERDRKINGIEVIKRLHAKGFAGAVFGTSSNDAKKSVFIEHGALGNIDKIAFELSDEMKSIARLLAS